MEILVPVPDQAGEKGFRLAPRLESLAGSTIGLINNGWHSLALTYQEFRAILPERYGVVGFLEKMKPLTSPLAPEDMEELARRCQAVIVGLGN
jgi:hypothetical protein